MERRQQRKPKTVLDPFTFRMPFHRDSLLDVNLCEHLLNTGVA